MVLLIVAVVTALVSLSALGFMVSMRSENRVAHLQADQQQVDQIAASAVALIQELASLPRDEREAWGGIEQNSSLFRDVIVDSDLGGSRHGRFCVLSPRYTPESAQPVFQFGVTLASSKLSLTTLLRWDQQSPGAARMALLQLPGMTDAAADALLDWIDADDVPREFGAESEFYLGLSPPRQPPNRVPDRIDDLLAIRGVSAWQVLGEQDGPFPVVAPDGPLATQGPAPGNETPLDVAPLEAPATDAWLTPAPPWSAYLTLDSAERNENALGEPRIDLNQDDLANLQQQLTTAFDTELANFVIALRQYGPGGNSTDGADPASIAAVDTTRAATHRLELPLDVIDATVRIPNEASDDEEQATTYRSPLSARETASLSQLVQFCDRTTTDPAPRLTGQINVMLAARPVLLGIPNLTAEQVDRLISARAQRASEPGQRAHPVWMYLEQIVDLETMRSLWADVTVGGDMLEAQIVAYYDARSPWMRHEIVVDGTGEEVPTIYYRDLRRLGRAFRWSELVSPLPAQPADAATPPLPFARPVRNSL